MTIAQAIEHKNSQKLGRTFKVSKNWVMVKFDSDKRFSDHSSVELFIERVIEEINNNNARINSKKTVDFLIESGLVIDNKSIYGSVYFYTKKGHLRVSNHHFTSEKYNSPKLNLCSYEVDGFKNMIALAKEFLN